MPEPVAGSSPDLSDPEVLLGQCVAGQNLARSGVRFSWRDRLENWKQRRSLAQALRWRQKRQSGRDLFILKHGMLFGGVSAVGGMALEFVVSPFSNADVVGLLVVALTVGAVGGVFNGVATWDREEANLERWLRQIQREKERK